MLLYNRLTGYAVGGRATLTIGSVALLLLVDDKAKEVWREEGLNWMDKVNFDFKSFLDTSKIFK